MMASVIDNVCICLYAISAELQKEGIGYVDFVIFETFVEIYTPEAIIVPNINI